MATASEIQIESSLAQARLSDAASIQRFGQTQALDPGMIGAPTDAVQRDIDSLNQAREQRGALGANYKTPQSKNLVGRLAELRRAARVTAVGKPEGIAAKAINVAYARYVSAMQDELLANVLALEVFVSPWVYLTVFFLRITGGLFPMQIKGLRLIPPYNLRTMSGIGEFISHLGGAFLILIILTIILVVVVSIVWFITAPLWTKVTTIVNLQTGVLKVLYDLVTHK